MDKMEYEELEKVEIKNVVWEIRDKFRGVYSNYRFVDLIAVLYISLIIEEKKESNTLLKQIEKKVKSETSRNYLKKIILKNKNEVIEEIAEKYSEEELKAAILFSQPEIFSEIDMISTPEGISDLAIRLLDIGDEDTVLDLGSGINSFLIEAYIETNAKQLKGVELNTESLIVGHIRSLVLGIDINMVQGNMLSQDFTSLNANKVFCNPPLGMHWREVKDYVMENTNLSGYFESTKRTISGDWAYALSAYLNQRKSGKTVVTMSNAGTWNQPDEVIRKALLEKGIIEGVISLPVNIFTSTTMDLIIMILSEGNEKVKMVDASKIYTKGRRLNTLESEDIQKINYAYNNHTDISRLVDIKEIKHQEYILNPKRFVGEKVEIENSIKLGDIAKSINRGAMITSKKLDDLVSKEKTNYQYIMLQNIKDGEIDKELSYLKELDDSYDKYCIKDNSIIISKLSPYKIALANIKEGMNIVANGNLYFLEIDEEKANPIFLTNFLQSELGIQQLNMYAKGTVMKSISIRDLKEIEIPNLSIEEQNRIAEAIRQLDDELIILSKQVDIIKDKKVKLIQGVI